MKTRLLSLLSLSAALLLTACGSKISLDTYNQLKVGQSFDEVKQLAGEPAKCDETLGVRSCSWGTAEHGFDVNFVAGKVVLLSARNLK